MISWTFGISNIISLLFQLSINSMFNYFCYLDCSVPLCRYDSRISWITIVPLDVNCCFLGLWISPTVFRSSFNERYAELLLPRGLYRRHTTPNLDRVACRCLDPLGWTTSAAAAVAHGGWRRGDRGRRRRHAWGSPRYPRLRRRSRTAHQREDPRGVLEHSATRELAYLPMCSVYFHNAPTYRT